MDLLNVDRSCFLNKEISDVYFKGLSNLSNYNDFCLIEEGNLILALVGNKLIEVYFDDKITFEIIDENRLLDGFIRLENKFWKNISSPKITDVVIFQNEFYSNSNSKVEVKNYDVTLQIKFVHGENLFISNAGFITETRISSFTGDLMIYSKRDVGEQFNLYGETQK